MDTDVKTILSCYAFYFTWIGKKFEIMGNLNQTLKVPKRIDWFAIWPKFTYLISSINGYQRVFNNILKLYIFNDCAI